MSFGVRGEPGGILRRCAKVRTFTLKWEGWVREAGLPNRAGVYCVCAARISRKPDGTEIVYHNDARLAYIGETADMARRVADHERQSCWNRQRLAGQALVFTYALLPTAEVDENWRRSVENCLIVHHLPPCNEAGTEYNWTKSVVVQNTGTTFGRLKPQHKCKGTQDPQDP